MEFKTLTHLGQFVDTNLLEKGIYTKSTPQLYSIDETIESLVERGKRVKDMSGANFISDRYFENLQKCELSVVEVKFVD
jgi:hypothetical protein